MPKAKETIRDAVLRHVRFNPGRSATQIANDLGKKFGSVSSVLTTLFKAGEVEYAPNPGPRGGCTYRIPAAKLGPPSNKTSWAHLLDEDGL